jgi:hypothetical protein
MFFIDNDTDIGLLIKTGDLLGDYYPPPHHFVRAQRGLMMMSTYKELIENGRGYNVEDMADEEELTPNPPPPTPHSPLLLRPSTTTPPSPSTTTPPNPLTSTTPPSPSTTPPPTTTTTTTLQ